MFKKTVTVREFLNKYNALDNYLRDICGASESKGMISLYKDTLSNPEEQLKLKTMNKLRNELAHGVFPTDDPIQIDVSLVHLLDKHLKYVSHHPRQVKEKMLVAMENRRLKDEEKEAVVYKNQEAPTRNNTIRKIYIEDISGVLTIMDSPTLICDFNSSINGDTLIISDGAGIGKIGLPAGRYELLSFNNISGMISVLCHNATFDTVLKNNISGIVNVN